MDFVKNLTGGNNSSENANSSENEQQSGGGGFLSGIGNKINSAAGGGAEGEKNEDYLDKGEHLRYV